MKKDKTIIERLVQVETLLTNHLHHHEQLSKYFLLPITVGVVLLLVKAYWIK